ncbi:antimicrobial resistance protein Mig-14 [Proteus mirabilis]|uniref:antimicrobial resistance protein Mig-14 n=1 Tax=Proteus mirabilis TaxID=584 RepID=UPI001FFD733F|nr:antimicrobial resistance protein Mig-14 [Proteus mirabilis]
MFFKTGWQQGSIIEYQEAYNQFGGSVITAPDILDFIHNRYSLKENFFIKKDKNNKVIGAFCTWYDKYLAGEQKVAHNLGLCSYMLNFDEIILPLSPNEKFFIPAKSKFLSEKHKNQVINSFKKINAHREICLVKKLSKKTVSTRNRELHKFIKRGGYIENVSKYSSAELVDIYDGLYFKRRNEHCNKNKFLELIENFPDLPFGNILWLENKPVAMQFIIKKDSPRWVCFDYINSGMDMNYPDLSLGTIAAWVNVHDAIEYANKKGLELRYCFGRPTFDYKERWCNRFPLQRVISI